MTPVGSAVLAQCAEFIFTLAFPRPRTTRQRILLKCPTPLDVESEPADRHYRLCDQARGNAK